MLALGKGEGIVSVFDANGRFLRLRTPQGDPLVIPILWGMAFGNGILNQPTDVLFFAAGPLRCRRALRPHFRDATGTGGARAGRG